MMDLIRDKFVEGDLSSITVDESGITLVAAEEFSYTDPVDGSTTSKQGLILSFEGSNGDPSRVVFRLSGTGSAGATIRMYLERYEKDVTKHDEAAPVALKALAERAIGLVQMQQLTGRDAPTVVT
jgi:phosphoglucomutase